MNEPSPARPWLVYPTALLEGAAVIVVEIAGARALAPFFGTSLQVWTAQITVTLFFLAAGYGLGGLLARRLTTYTLPMLFAIAGITIAAYPLVRTPLLNFSSEHWGVAVGSLVSAAVLFGPTLLMFGAVSPVLIAHIDERRPGAGSAAGRLFFTNTMGGLAGGWLVAFALIPHTSLRVSLVATGVVLLGLALLWVAAGRSGSAVAVVPLFLVAGYILLYTHPQRVSRDKNGNVFEMVYSHQSGIGLVQVLDFFNSRCLLINGVLQGQMGTDGQPLSQYISNMNALAAAHHTGTKSALQLGLGAGLLPKQLVARGVSVTAIEIEPRVEMLARTHFGLPKEVDVRVADARAFLRHAGGTYDLVLLDTFASESTPWHMLTVEAFREMRDRLTPAGRLIINTVCFADLKKPAMEGLESSLLAVFPEALIYTSKPETADPEELVNVLIVAGDRLDARIDARMDRDMQQKLNDILSRVRPARRDAGPLCTDDRSDLDYVQAAMRIHWRKLIWQYTPSDVLWD